MFCCMIQFVPHLSDMLGCPKLSVSNWNPSKEEKTTREMCVMVSFSCSASERGVGENFFFFSNRDTYTVIYY